jgi:hypothetical protein
MNDLPRKPPSGKQRGRLLLPSWLRTATDDMLRAEYAIGMGDPSLAVEPGSDVPDSIAALVAEADAALRHSCRKHLLAHALAPHARWVDDVTQKPSAWRSPSIEELEERLAALANDGDRSAILAMLAALDPARYGPPGKVLPPGDNTVDTVDFSPAIVTKA